MRKREQYSPARSYKLSVYICVHYVAFTWTDCLLTSCHWLWCEHGLPIHHDTGGRERGGACRGTP